MYVEVDLAMTSCGIAESVAGKCKAQSQGCLEEAGNSMQKYRKDMTQPNMQARKTQDCKERALNA